MILNRVDLDNKVVTPACNAWEMLRCKRMCIPGCGMLLPCVVARSQKRGRNWKRHSSRLTPCCHDHHNKLASDKTDCRWAEDRWLCSSIASATSSAANMYRLMTSIMTFDLGTRRRRGRFHWCYFNIAKKYPRTSSDASFQRSLCPSDAFVVIWIFKHQVFDTLKPCQVCIHKLTPAFTRNY